MKSLLDKPTFLVFSLGIVIAIAISINKLQSGPQTIALSGIIQPIESAFKSDRQAKQFIVKEQNPRRAGISIQLTGYKKISTNRYKHNLPLKIDTDTAREQIFAVNNMIQLDEILNKQATDPDWSHKAAKKITELLTSKDFKGSNLISVTCGATLCRVKTRQKDPYVAKLILNKFPLLIEWDTHAYAQIFDLDNGEFSVVLYISREGHHLPSVKR